MSSEIKLFCMEDRDMEEAIINATLMEDVLDWHNVEEGSYLDTDIYSKYLGYDNIYSISSEDFDQKIIRDIFNNVGGTLLLDISYEGIYYKVKSTTFGNVMLLKDTEITALNISEDTRNSILTYIESNRE